jgi:hypothetical protein
MKKSTVIVLSVCGSILLVTCIVLSLVYGLPQAGGGGGSGPSPPPVSPQDQCNANGYIWDPVHQVCTSNQCSASVDVTTGVITGTMIDSTGETCINVNQSGAYVSPFARAALLQLCQKANFANLEVTPTGLQCTSASGCNTKPYVSNSVMDGCPYLTYQPSSGNNNNNNGACVPPTLTQLQNLCTVSVNGCPENSNLNVSCSPGQPCFDPNKGCLAQEDTPGCRPAGQTWQWSGTQCVNATVSNTIAVTVSTATVDSIQGTFVFDNPPQNAKLMWMFLLTASTTGQVWQGPVTIQSSQFNVDLTGLPVTVNSVYKLVLQVYSSVNDSPYVLQFTSVTPNNVTLTAAPVAPGLVTIKPQLSLDLAKKEAANVPGAILAANQNSQGSNPFVVPSPDQWTNSLQGSLGDFLLVPCTTAYCKNTLSDGIAMLILAWPAVGGTLTSQQSAEIKKACPSLSSSSPQVSYAVYQNGTLVGDKLTEGTWLQPVPSDPTVTNTFTVVGYVWSGSDPGIQSSTCLSQPLHVTVQAPTNLYSPEVCYSIQPLKPQGAFIPGNFMLYHPGDNMCSAPVNSVEALGARDFSCLIQQPVPTLQSLQLYGCTDIGTGDTCNSSGQGCQPIVPVTTVRQPGANEAEGCTAPVPGTVPPCGGLQYCQQAACNCPDTVNWALCGSTTYAQVGANNAIEATRWQSRVNNVANFIQNYGLDKLVNVQTFLNESSSPQSIQTAWDTNYGSSICPLPKWNAPSPTSCDVTSSNACTQPFVCGPWLPDENVPALYKQQVVQYPTQEQQGDCCPTNSSYYAGCCCPSVGGGGSSCADLKNCVPLSTGTLGPTWCTPSK